MTVNDLRETLTRLAGLLEAAGAKAATTRDLSEFVDLTAPFGEVSLKAFVRLAEAGRTPRQEGAGRPKAAKAAASTDGVEAEVQDVYARAGEEVVTLEQVRAACGRLGGLTKDALLRVAAGVELSVPKSVQKGALVKAITDRVVDRKETAIRRTLLDRPAGVDPHTRLSSEPPVLTGG